MARKRLSENPVIVSSPAAPARHKSATPKRASNKTEIQPSIVPVEPVAEILSPSAPVAPSYVPSYQEVAKLAYSYWEARGCQGGSPEQDWLQAERELSAK